MYIFLLYLGGKRKVKHQIMIMSNIQESKEYQLAKEWEMAVNSYDFDPKKFAAAIPSMPRHSNKAFTDWSRSVSRSWLMKTADTMTATERRTKKQPALWRISTNTERIYH